MKYAQLQIVPIHDGLSAVFYIAMLPENVGMNYDIVGFQR